MEFHWKVFKRSQPTYHFWKSKWTHCILGVPATSWILTGDSQKLGFSILTQIPFLIFWSDKPPRRANSAHHIACSQAGTWYKWAEVAHWQGVSYRVVKYKLDLFNFAHLSFGMTYTCKQGAKLKFTNGTFSH